MQPPRRNFEQPDEHPVVPTGNGHRSFVVQSIHHRRYPLVDAEHGVVWSHAVFDQGTVNKGVLSTGQEYTFRGFNRPSSILVSEAFLIENGKIRRVEMIGPASTYHLNSAWPGGLSGN